MFPLDRTLMPQTRAGESLVRVLHASEEARRREYLQSLYLDWLSLAESDALVLTLSSNFGCVAYLLALYVKSVREAAGDRQGTGFFYAFNGLASAEPRRTLDRMDRARSVGGGAQPRVLSERELEDERERLAQSAEERATPVPRCAPPQPEDPPVRLRSLHRPRCNLLAVPDAPAPIPRFALRY
jgi:hypothetical protein